MSLTVLDPRSAAAAAPPPAPPVVRPRAPRRAWCLLAVVLVLGAALRLVGLNWDDGHRLHPDERFITMVTNAIGLPSNPLEYFDTARSPLNPYNRGHGSFVYGTAPLFLVRVVAELGHWNNFSDATLLGRAMGALADLATIVFVFLIGCRLFRWQVGLLGALLVAFTPMHIQQSHFYTMDTWLALFLVAGVYYGIRVAQEGGLRNYLLLGLCFGLAVASKVSAATFGLVVFTACAVRAWQLWYAPASPALGPVGSALDYLRGRFEPAEAVRGGRSRRPNVEEAVAGFLLALIVAAIAFRIFQPYAFAGPSIWDFGLSPKYVSDMDHWRRVSVGEADYPPGVQWANRTPYLYPFEQMLNWGMGVPLGLACWAGVALAVFALLRGVLRHRTTPALALAVPLVWIGFNWAYWGSAFLKPMRYFLPIYPLLILLAAWLLVAAWDWGRERQIAATASQRLRLVPAGALQRLALALVAVVVGWTMLYGLAYAGIYTRTTTRVAASEWIMRNLPEGTRVANEHWDDPVPLRVLGRDSLPWAGPQLELYGEEEPVKRERLIAALDQADIVAITSSRLISSIPRIPERYPLAIEYYRLLFNGELGFERIADFTSYPQLGPLRWVDDAAEELWVNYDHPRVQLFRKTPAYSTANAQALLGRVNMDQVVKGLRPVQAHTRGLLMTPSMREAQQQGGTWSQIVDRDSLVNAFPAQAWWLVAVLLGLIVYPLVWSVFGRLADRGYAVAKIVAIALLSWGAWMLASLQIMPYTRESILLVLLLLAVGSALVLWRRGAAFVADLRARFELLLFVEAVFAATYVLFLTVRLANPDLWHGNFGGEKPMDFAYLNAVLKSSYFPPYDPWYAGGYINYYYFGFVLVATLIKLTGLVPSVAYNVAIALVFALLASACFSFVFSLVAGPRARTPARTVTWATLGGLLGVVFVCVMGNLDGLLQVVDQVTGRRLPGHTFDFWRSTRVIGPEEPQPITEFPWFTFLYGDLHAHMLALPLTLLAICIALALVRGPGLLPLWTLLQGQPWPPAPGPRPERPRPFAHLRLRRPRPPVVEAAPVALGAPNSYAAAWLAWASAAPDSDVATEQHAWAAAWRAWASATPDANPALDASTAPGASTALGASATPPATPAPEQFPSAADWRAWASAAAAATPPEVGGAEPIPDRLGPAAPSAPPPAPPRAVPVWAAATGAAAHASDAAQRATVERPALAPGLATAAAGAPVVEDASALPADLAGANGHALATPDANGHDLATGNGASAAPLPAAPLLLASPRAREGVVEAFLPWAPRPVQAVRVAEIAAPAPPPLPWGARLRGILKQEALWLAALGGLTVGLLRMVNTWDFPTYLVLLMAAGAVAEYRAGGISVGSVIRAGAFAALLYVVAALVVQPYQKSYALFYTGVERLGVHTSLNHYLTIHGFVLFAIGSVLVWQLWLLRGRLLPRLVASPMLRELAPTPGFWSPPPQRGTSATAAWLQPGTLLAIGGSALFLILVVLLLAKHVVPALVLLFLVAILVLTPWHRQSGDRLLILGMIALSLALTAVVEFVALRGDVGRMNTVFKFYLQVWVMLGLAAAWGVVWLLRRWRPRQSGWRIWGAALAVLAAACLIYPVQATPIKTALRFVPNLPPTLDGMAYMKDGVYPDKGQAIPLAGDYDAVRWMQDNIPGSPVILEAQVPEYRWGSRVSILTGLPAVVGWNWHQRQQRGDFGGMVFERVNDVQKMYDTTSVEELERLLNKYEVVYIYVGPYERAYYPEAGLAKFRALTGTRLDLVYDANGAQIYRVRGRG